MRKLYYHLTGQLSSWQPLSKSIPDSTLSWTTILINHLLLLHLAYSSWSTHWWDFQVRLLSLRLLIRRRSTWYRCVPNWSSSFGWAAHIIAILDMPLHAGHPYFPSLCTLDIPSLKCVQEDWTQHFCDIQVPAKWLQPNHWHWTNFHWSCWPRNAHEVLLCHHTWDHEHTSIMCCTPPQTFQQRPKHMHQHLVGRHRAKPWVSPVCCSWCIHNVEYSWCAVKSWCTPCGQWLHTWWHSSHYVCSRWEATCSWCCHTWLPCHFLWFQCYENMDGHGCQASPCPIIPYLTAACWILCSNSVVHLWTHTILCSVLNSPPLNQDSGWQHWYRFVCCFWQCSTGPQVSMKTALRRQIWQMSWRVGHSYLSRMTTRWTIIRLNLNKAQWWPNGIQRQTKQSVASSLPPCNLILRHWNLSTYISSETFGISSISFQSHSITAFIALLFRH